MKLKTILIGTLALACSTVFADANVAPKITIQQALSTAEKAGYTDIREIEFEHGKWEVKGRDAHGKKFKVKIDATSGELSKATKK